MPVLAELALIVEEDELVLAQTNDFALMAEFEACKKILVIATVIQRDCGDLPLAYDEAQAAIHRDEDAR